MNNNSTKFNHYFNLLKKSPYFSLLDEVTIKEVLQTFHIETWKKGDFPFNYQRTKQNFYFVVSGRVKVFQINSISGQEYILEILGEGSLFDVICLLDNQEHKVYTEALDDVETMVVPVKIAKQWLVKYPEFNKTLLPYLGKQLRFYEESATDLALLNTWSRTIKLFVSHVSNKAHNSQLKLINNLSHTELASMIGSARNVLNRHLQKLKEEDIIQIERNHIEIKNIEALLNKLNNE
jgi:CRP/FNR family transcriptional regulator